MGVRPCRGPRRSSVLLFYLKTRQGAVALARL
jgi:hypothetical protein